MKVVVDVPEELATEATEHDELDEVVVRSLRLYLNTRNADDLLNDPSVVSMP